MAWRVMNSLVVLYDQVNAIAPGRSKASDGTIGDEAHQGTNSDHNPHYVAGVGSEIVTARDFTHDPAGGFDSYAFAETLRRNRDARIEYVISNGRIFSSYQSGSRAPWTWGPYSGSNLHDKHCHVSVLDSPASDKSTSWNLEGFAVDSLYDDNANYRAYVTAERAFKILVAGLATYDIKAFPKSTGGEFPAITGERSVLMEKINALPSAEKVQELIDKVDKLTEDVNTLIDLVRADTGSAGSYTATGTLVLERAPQA